MTGSSHTPVLFDNTIDASGEEVVSFNAGTRQGSIARL